MWGYLPNILMSLILHGKQLEDAGWRRREISLAFHRARLEERAVLCHIYFIIWHSIFDMLDARK
jgi:hypothetical protein